MDVSGDSAVSGASNESVVDSFRGFFMSASQRESDQIFRLMDSDHSRTASQDEISKFVASNDKLWSMVSKKLGQPREVATQIATRVAMELASGLTGKEALEAELTQKQFHQFRQKYVLDPAGSQEFFYRAVFANFDMDGSADLDEEELDQFLDTLYELGDQPAKLPPRDAVKDVIVDKLDIHDNKRFSYVRIRGVISGEAADELHKAVEEAEARKLREKEVAAKKAEAERLMWEARKAEEEAIAEERKKQEEKLAAKRAAEEARRKKDWDFCDWLDRKLSPESYDEKKGAVTRKSFCKRNNCVIQ